MERMDLFSSQYSLIYVKNFTQKTLTIILIKVQSTSHYTKSNVIS